MRALPPSSSPSPRTAAGFLVFSRARLSPPSLLLFPGTTRLFIRTIVTDHHHPVIAQHQRLMRTTAQNYGLPPPPPPWPPEKVRQLLDHHPAQPIGSADAI